MKKSHLFRALPILAIVISLGVIYSISTQDKSPSATATGSTISSSKLTKDSTTGEFKWHHNLAQARAIARSQKKPMLLVFRCEP